MNHTFQYYNLNTTIIKLLLHTQPTFLPWHFGLCQWQWPSSEEACSVLLPVLVTTEMWRGKKSVVGVAQHAAARIPVQGSPSLCPNMYCFFAPPSTFVRLSVQNCSIRPISHIVIPRCVVRRTEQASSGEGLWQRPKRQGKNVGCVWSKFYLL